MKKNRNFWNVILGMCVFCLSVCVDMLYSFAKNESLQHGKMYRNYMFLDEWMNKKREDPDRIVRTLNEMNYKKIAIYGAGYLGCQLYRELQNSSIHVEYMIDNYRKESGLPVQVFPLRDLPKPVDAIIISILHEGKKIEDNIRIQTGIDTRLLEDLI